MNPQTDYPAAELMKISNFDISSLEDEIRADHLCAALLKRFHLYLQQESKLGPHAAGSRAGGADYFLREFVIGHQRENIYSVTAEQVRKFAAHWYIVRTLEPNLAELDNLLAGTGAFYAYLADKNLLDPATAQEIQLACQDIETYRERIESFNAITGAGFTAWTRAFPLE